MMIPIPTHANANCRSALVECVPSRAILALLTTLPKNFARQRGAGHQLTESRRLTRATGTASTYSSGLRGGPNASNGRCIPTLACEPVRDTPTPLVPLLARSLREKADDSQIGTPQYRWSPTPLLPLLSERSPRGALAYPIGSAVSTAQWAYRRNQ